MKNFPIIFVLQLLAATQLFSRELPSGHVIWWGNNSGGETTGVHQTGSSTGVVSVTTGFLTGVTSISASSFFSLALKNDGTVFGWGWNDRGMAIGSQSQNPDHTNGLVMIRGSVLSNVCALAAGGNFSLALNENGVVAAWGSSQQGETSVPIGLDKIIAVAAGEFHALALKQNGTVASWGGRSNSLLGMSNIVAVSAAKSWFGDDLALRNDGGVVAWSISEGGTLIETVVKNITAIAAGDAHYLALKNDGSVAEWSLDSRTPASVAGLSNVTAIAAGHKFSMALKKDGTVVLWGDKRFYRDVPAGLTNVTAIAAGHGFCLAITTNTSFLENKK